MAQGTVNKIHYNGKAYNAEIGGAWYGCGFEKPKFEEGQVIEFEFGNNGKFKNMMHETVKVLGTDSGSKPAPKGGAVDPQVWIDKDISILYQSCRKDAIQFVNVLLTSSAVTLPAKKADQADAIKALVEDYAAQFYVKTKDVIEAGGCTLEDSVPSFS